MSEGYERGALGSLIVEIPTKVKTRLGRKAITNRVNEVSTQLRTVEDCKERFYIQHVTHIMCSRCGASFISSS